jgi:iron complex transport system substrate-binding protein
LRHPNEIATAVVHAAYRAFSTLGPGLLEIVYETVMSRDLSNKDYIVERQKPISFDYEGLWFENAFKIDLLVDHQVIVEIKSRKELRPSDFQQTLTYLRLTGCKLGLLINFSAPTIKDGIKRIVNNL